MSHYLLLLCNTIFAQKKSVAQYNTSYKPLEHSNLLCHPKEGPYNKVWILFEKKEKSNSGICGLCPRIYWLRL